MAGTLTISTLSDGTNSTSSTNCIQGSAKQWVCFNGTTATIKASYNTSSVTRNGTGDYIVNFTNALADANYSAQVATQTWSVDYNTKTSSSLRVTNYITTSGANVDSADVSVACFR